MKNSRIASASILLVTAMALGVAGQQSETPGQLTQRDQLRAAAQQICPVSGKPLGSMGTPIKTKIGKEQLFLCCKACTKGKVSREHWGTVHANFKRAQATCPVMGKPLPAKSKWTVVEGQIVYVCCPPCIPKIEADPAKWLTRVDALYAASANPISDKLKIAAQKICPVSGRKLGSQGTPLKTKIGKEELFLCCKACAKGKVNPTHWATIHNNFKQVQARCPVMDKPLPPNPKWTVVDGQIVYICCPPCAEKIQAGSHTYRSKVAKLYRASLSTARN